MTRLVCDPTETLAEHIAKQPTRTEAEFRTEREKREANYIARESIRLEQMQFNRLFGGLK